MASVVIDGFRAGCVIGCTGLGLVLGACGSSSTDGAPDATQGTAGTAGSIRMDAGTSGAVGKGGAGGAGADGNTGSGARGGGANSASGGASGASGASGAGGGAYIPPTCRDSGTGPAPKMPTLTAGVWKDISPIPGFFSTGIAFDPCNRAMLYAPGHSNGTGWGAGVLYRSTDGGSTWESLTTALGQPGRARVDPEDPLHLYMSDGVGGGTNGFWISHDGGRSWTMTDGFRSAAATVNCYDVYRAEPDPSDFRHVLVTFHSAWHGGDNAGIFETFDGGDTWTIHQPDPGWSGAAGYNALFLYDPSLGVGNSKTWLYGTQGKGYWRTTDSGTTWTKVTDISMDHGGGQLYYARSSALYASSAEGVIRSKDNGASWVRAGTTTANLSVTGDGSNLYTGWHGGGSFITAKEAADTVWTNYNTQTFKEGPLEMAYDEINGILYSSNISGGLWALKVK